jgi:hypothetical protein
MRIKMSDIYKEALAEAAKIREVAEQDARNAILEQISPYIKKMIMRESANVLLEQEDVPPADASDSMPVSSEPAIAEPTSMGANDMPVKPAGESTEEAVNVSMGAGSAVIDFNDLFSDKPASEVVNPSGMDSSSSMEVATVNPPIEGEPVAPAPGTAAPTAAFGAPPAEAGPPPAPETAGAAAEEEVPPTPPAPLAEIKTVKQLERQLAEMAVKIDRIYTTKVSNLTKDSYKTKLFSLLEQLDKLAANKAITPRQAQLNENRLEFLFLHLKEANQNNSYKTKDKEKTMTTLKEFAAKLFESADVERLGQDSKTSGDTGVAVHKKASAHAMKASGVHADLFGGGTKTVEKHAGAGTVDAEALEGLEGEEGPWEEALMEEIQAALRDELDAHEERPEELPAAVKNSGYFDINEAALRSAVAKLRKEGAGAKAAPAKSMDESLVLSVDLPAEVEEQLAGEDLSVDLMFSDEEGEEEMEMGDEEEEVVDLDMSSDEEDMEDMGGEEGMLLTDEEEEEEEEEEEGDEEIEEAIKPPMMESRRARKALLEARTATVKARRLAEAKRAEAATLKKEMAETNLFLSKLVYLNKFLVREDLSRKVKQQIVEHLDRASTISEAKDIYGKIVRKLDEAAAAQTAPVVGSASKPTTAGSARLNESVSRVATSGGSAGDPVIGTFEKWQILANIKKNG